MNRRRFLENAAIVAGTAALRAGSPVKAESAARRKLKKSVGLYMVEGSESVLDQFKLLKDLGFDGVEVTGGSYSSRDEIVAARDKTGLPIHSVVVGSHWKYPLSDPDPEIREKGLEGLKHDLGEAKFFGANVILFVPARVDERTAYDEAYTRSQEGIRKTLPLAEKLGITILIENVWNNFLLSPLEAVRYVDEFNSPFVKAYFDVGNIMLYGWPEHWIRILGKRIRRIHIKEFSRRKAQDEGLWKGFEVELLEGDNNWPAIMKTVQATGYNEEIGWYTAEIPGGDRGRLQAIAERMDRILAI
ncbi:MAG: sugar phosphate isomerase/epimerase [Phycisphaerales bacterium]|nr:sugar phosphate isomerase/epimerase [Phycisphaerales bacterium]